MSSILDINRINREDFMKLNEDNLMFITSPGRMGDEDGSTFVIKEDNNYKMYRIDGWIYPTNKKKDNITYEEMRKQFPKWDETLNNMPNDNYNGKYVFIYMGFGNSLCVDKRIYDKYLPYLLEEIKKQNPDIDIKEQIPYHLYYSAWLIALKKMINEEV